MTTTKTALIAGASGLVGGHCLNLLLQSNRYEKVIALLRKPLPVQHPKLEQRLLDFDKIPELAATLAADDVFCCLGTTMKQAGSKENFYKVDYTYVAELAKATYQKPGTQFLVVSAMGADKNSLFYYNRVKGEMEETVSNLPFAAVHIFRPSLLLGNRSETRAGEKIGEKVMESLKFALVGPLKKYRAIEARTVARAMVTKAAGNTNG
ncbi:MAG TPA: oxidoreductase, partial [Adhaeribacter sp.]|nr:oxidoreductase [Adhaeribacter sp.]